MEDIRRFLQIVEGKQVKLSQEPLPYTREELDPVMSKDTLDYHYGKLARAYVDRYNKGEGDPKFNHNGAVLHNIFFSGLKEPANNNKPAGASKELIERKFGSFDKFKEAVAKEAMSIQGSGWIFVDSSGNIRTIVNHNLTGNADRIALLIDWWEHAWALDYQADKKKYLENHWRIINWDVVNQRLGAR